MNKDAFRLVGAPTRGGLLVVADHASNRVPADIDLGIDDALLARHIAFDIGVAQVAALMAARPGTAAFLAGVSRLVCDCNRDEHQPALIPLISDGHAIPGNALAPAAREARIARFFRPYHAALAALLVEHPPALILSLHSFTPALASDPGQQRPWEVGVLYDADDRAARIAIPLLAAEGLAVGDQQPYSGKLLNATMNRHAEAHGRAYLGVEVRQDQILTAAAQTSWARRLGRVCAAVSQALA